MMMGSSSMDEEGIGRRLHSGRIIYVKQMDEQNNPNGI
jgi:hypothetical protein